MTPAPRPARLPALALTATTLLALVAVATCMPGGWSTVSGRAECLVRVVLAVAAVHPDRAEVPARESAPPTRRVVRLEPEGATTGPAANALRPEEGTLDLPPPATV